MKIAVIGTGNVGSTLALAFKKAGHEVVFGGNNRFGLIEQFALSWITLAIMQKQGRGMAFRVVKR